MAQIAGKWIPNGLYFSAKQRAPHGNAGRYQIRYLILLVYNN